MTRTVVGGYTGYAMTLQAVAEELGITAERVRQIETKALRKIAERMAEVGLDGILPDQYGQTSRWI